MEEKIKGIEIKKFKELKHGHGDTMTFEAEIWMDGKKIGWVNNEGCGGDNCYQIEQRDEFHRRCKEWTEEDATHRFGGDSLIGELIRLKEGNKIKRQNIKIGLPVTILCRKNELDFDGMKIWDEEWYVGLKNKGAIQPYIDDKKEGVEEYQII